MVLLDRGFSTSIMSNPIIRRLGKVTDTAEKGHAATYAGIGFKTIFFLLLTAGGVLGFFFMRAFFSYEDVGADAITFGAMSVGMHEIVVFLIAAFLTLITPFLAWIIRPTIPVTGSLYAASQGFVIAFSANLYGGEYIHLIWLALFLTIIIILAMLILYMARIIKVDKKFNSVLKVLFFSSILGSIGIVVCRFIPLTADFANYILNNAVISIGGSILMIIIAALFLLSDFDAVEKTVEHQLPKKYEWAAAFGLVFTVIWLYLKVLNLLVKLTSRK